MRHTDASRPARSPKDVGKVSLVAVVHYEDQRGLRDADTKRREKKFDRRSASKSTTTAKISTGLRLARLFAKKKPTAQVIDGRQAGGTGGRSEVGDCEKRSDGRETGRPADSPAPPRDRRGQLAGRTAVSVCGGSNENFPSSSSASSYPTTDETSFTRQIGAGDRSPTAHYQQHHRRRSADLSAGRQVIEFKFDLIVERLGASAPSSPLTQQHQRCKLELQVERLVDSFALDASDVCIISLGEQTLRPAEQPASASDTAAAPAADAASERLQRFDYITRLAERALRRSFQQLELQRSRKQSAQGDPAERPEQADSIELGAALVVGELAPTRVTRLLDLLGSGGREAQARAERPEHLEGADAELSAAVQHQTVDCSSLADCSPVLERIRARLAGQWAPASAAHCLLLITLKLKQTISGGQFSNRLCLIDFDPKLTQMRHILECIFNGSALAHLKGRQRELRTLASPTLSDELHADGRLAPVKHHIHQVASQETRKLAQAEWLLYKQLSAALIRTLAVVHVHKLADGGDRGRAGLGANANKGSPPTGAQAERRRLLEAKLIGDTLELLDFARTLQRAASVRMRRRRRHLRSHLAATSALSVASTHLSGWSAAPTGAHPVSPLHRPLGLQQLHQQLDRPTSRQLRRQQQQQQQQQQHHQYQCARRSRAHRLVAANATLGAHPSRRPQCRASAAVRAYLCADEWPSAPPPALDDERLWRRHRRGDRNDLETSSASSSGPKLNARALASYPAGDMSDSADSISTSAHLELTNLSSPSGFARPMTRKSSLTSSSSSSNRQPPTQAVEQPPVGLANWLAASDRRQRQIAYFAPESGPSSPSELAFPSTATSATLQNSSNLAGSAELANPHGAQLGADFNVIHIDCCRPASSLNRLSDSLSQLTSVSSTAIGQGIQSQGCRPSALDENLDGVSDICSLVAEPPKQLRLEEFLSQLSSIIAPMSSINQSKALPAAASSTNAPQTAAGRGQGAVDLLGSSANKLELDTSPSPTLLLSAPNKIAVDRNEELSGANGSIAGSRALDGLQLNGRGENESSSGHRGFGQHEEEEDDDCKSHSSILEHLSSLVFDSSKEERPPDGRGGGAESANSTPGQQVEPAGCVQTQATNPGGQSGQMGYLQRILRSQRAAAASSAGSRVPVSVESQLRALASLSSHSHQLADQSTTSGGSSCSDYFSSSSSTPAAADPARPVRHQPAPAGAQAQASPVYSTVAKQSSLANVEIQ